MLPTRMATTVNQSTTETTENASKERGMHADVCLLHRLYRGLFSLGRKHRLKQVRAPVTNITIYAPAVHHFRYQLFSLLNKRLTSLSAQMSIQSSSLQVIAVARSGLAESALSLAVRTTHRELTLLLTCAFFVSFSPQPHRVAHRLPRMR